MTTNEMQTMLKMLTDESIETLVAVAKEERRLRHARRDFENNLRGLIADAKGMGFEMCSKETGEILEDVPFYFA